MRLTCRSYSFDDALEAGTNLTEFFEVCASDLGVDGSVTLEYDGDENRFDGVPRAVEFVRGRVDR